MYNKNHKILLGHTVVELPKPLSIRTEDEELEWHLDKPWLREYITKHFGIDLDQQPSGPKNGTPVEISAGLLAQHGIILGTTGSGKTTVALNIAYEQLKAGASLVVVDTTKDTIPKLIAVAEKAGLRKDQINVIWPWAKGKGIPGWNPLAAGGDLERNVADFMDVVMEGDKAGITYGPPLRRGATLIGALGLSVQEMIWFFLYPDYRRATLKKVKDTPSLRSLMKHVEYFETSYETSFGKVPPESVLNKILPLMESSFFEAMFTAQRDTLKLADLWQNQRVLLVHMGLDDGDRNRVLASLVVNQLRRIALRVEWKRPVILMIDELRLVEKVLGSTITDIQSVGRQQGFWLLAATQSLDLVPEQIKKGLLSLTSLKIFMRTSAEEARDLEKYLTASKSMPKTVVVSVAKRTKDELDEVWTEYAHLLMPNGSGGMWLWGERDDEGLYKDRILTFEDIEELDPNRELVVWYVGDLEIPLEKFWRGVYRMKFTPREIIRDVEFSFPKPRAIVKEWSTPEQGTHLASLDDYHGYVRVKTESLGLIKSLNFPLPKSLPNPLHFLGNGQSEAEIIQVAEERRERKEILLNPQYRTRKQEEEEEEERRWHQDNIDAYYDEVFPVDENLAWVLERYELIPPQPKSTTPPPKQEKPELPKNEEVMPPTTANKLEKDDLGYF